MRRVVITGMGAVTPVGNNVNDMWEAVKAGKCGISKITHFNTENSAVKLAGEVKGFDAEIKENGRFHDICTCCCR